MELTQLIDLINSEDIQDFDLAVNILETKNWNPRNTGLFISRNLDRNSYAYRYNLVPDNKVTHWRFSFGSRGGIWEQLDSGYKHTYAIPDFNFNDFEKVISDYFYGKK